MLCKILVIFAINSLWKTETTQSSDPMIGYYCCSQLTWSCSLRFTTHSARCGTCVSNTIVDKTPNRTRLLRFFCRKIILLKGKGSFWRVHFQ